MLDQSILQFLVFIGNRIKFKINQRPVVVYRAFCFLDVLVVYALAQLVFLEKYGPKHANKDLNIVFLAQIKEKLIKIGQINVFTFFLGKFVNLVYNMPFLD